jgi:hypothetical protein
LCWKTARKLWTNTIIDKLRLYKPYGPKGALPSYAMSSKLFNYFESIDMEAIKKYSYVMAKILEFLKIGNF